MWNKDERKVDQNSLLSEQEAELKRIQKATKSDDAEIPEHLWNDRITVHGLESSNHSMKRALDCIRGGVLRWWRRRTLQDFLRWFKQKYGHLIKSSLEASQVLRHKQASIDWIAGRDCIGRCSNTSWWDWDTGSRPLFWRWKSDYQQIIRDGLKLWFTSTPPSNRVPQRGESDPKLRAAIKEKLNQVRTKGYIQSGSVKSLTSFFSVPKGDNDIRIVYNGTQSGLNNTLWAPWFPLPTVEQHLRAVMPGTYMGDIDISEQFLNFMLHPKTQEYAGVDLTAYFSDECNTPSQIKQKHIIWERWTRCAMGFKPSPYQACQGTLHAEELMHGDPLDRNNPFHFDTVILNLPGNADFCPWKP